MPSDLPVFRFEGVAVASEGEQQPPTKTETIVMDLTKNWQPVGKGKVLMCATVPGVVFAVSDDEPSLPSGAGFVMPNDENCYIETRSIVWAKLTYDQASGKLTYAIL